VLSKSENSEGNSVVRKEAASVKCENFLNKENTAKAHLVSPEEVH